MLEAEVNISDELAARALLRAYRVNAIKETIKTTGGLMFAIWFFVAIPDFIYQTGSLVLVHFLFLFGLFLIVAMVEYYLWRKKIAASKGWSFYARLDSQGVVITYRYPETRNNWGFYKSYKEFDDYLEIESIGGISFVPKTPELFDLIEYTKQQIPQK